MAFAVRGVYRFKVESVQVKIDQCLVVLDCLDELVAITIDATCHRGMRQA